LFDQDALENIYKGLEARKIKSQKSLTDSKLDRTFTDLDLTNSWAMTEQIRTKDSFTNSFKANCFQDENKNTSRANNI